MFGNLFGRRARKEIQLQIDDTPKEECEKCRNWIPIRLLQFSGDRLMCPKCREKFDGAKVIQEIH